MPILVLNNWQGMLGNSILQTYNCILIALDKKYNIRLPDPNNNHRFSNYSKFYKKRDIILFENSCKKEIRNRYNFYYQKWLPEYKDSFTKNNNKALDILKNLLTFMDTNNTEVSDDTLVIHMRSGDIFSNCPHPKYVPPPLDFYTKIINEGKFNNYIICTQNNRNPCLRPLEKLNNVRWSGGNLGKDIELIMSAKNLAFGVGSFVPALLMLSNNIEYAYVASNYGVPGILEGEKCLFGKTIKIDEYDCSEYLEKIGERGVRTRYARDVMLSWPNSEDIIEEIKVKPKRESKPKNETKVKTNPVNVKIDDIECYDEITAEELKLLKMKRIVVRSGNFLDNITFVYENDKKRTYGSGGGRLTHDIQLDNEVIVSVQQIYARLYFGVGVILKTSKGNEHIIKGRKSYKDADLKDIFSDNKREIIGLKIRENEIIGIETREPVII